MACAFFVIEKSLKYKTQISEERARLTNASTQKENTILLACAVLATEKKRTVKKRSLAHTKGKRFTSHRGCAKVVTGRILKKNRVVILEKDP